MSTWLCLNELSCATVLQADQVDKAMREFVGALKQARVVRPGSVLLSPERLPSVELAAGYPMARWANDARNKDLWRLIRSMQARAPVTFDELSPPEDELEYLHKGRAARGLGVAHLVEGLAVSLPTEPDWLAERVTMTRNMLVTDGDLAEDQVDIPHASAQNHVLVHESWLARGGLTSIGTGSALWEARAEYFPSLNFLPRVEDDLGRLPADWLVPVRTRLIEIQEALAAWTPRNEAVPLWRSKITTEHEQRRRLCEFTDLDGEVRVFDMHARFTPRAGRLHFRLRREEQAATVAYIGSKLGV
ncbi:hypothetical protein ACFWIW_08665 [Amycolatopsis sp. NPDC058340]|uniref:hypothetical protein n=1 Tax=Amycolatopsis sp. NPDC058340 TaxID=3346453 RepID=UPI00366308CD